MALLEFHAVSLSERLFRHYSESTRERREVDFQPLLGAPVETQTEVGHRRGKKRRFQHTGILPVLALRILHRRGRIDESVRELAQESELRSVAETVPDLGADRALEEYAVLVLLEYGLVLGVEETVVELQPVVPGEVVLLVVGVGVNIRAHRVVVVTSLRPVRVRALDEVYVGLYRIGPVHRLGCLVPDLVRPGIGCSCLCRRLLGVRNLLCAECSGTEDKSDSRK